MTELAEIPIVDPIETVINFLRTRPEVQANIPNDQVSGQERFGNDQVTLQWERPSRALVIQRDGGDPDLYAEVQNVRLECRAYGKNYADAEIVYGTIQKVVRNFYNAGANPQAETKAGTALIKIFVMSSAPSRFEDPGVNVPCLLFFMNTQISELTV